MLCKSCGAQIADNSVFCTNCGVRLQPVQSVNAAASADIGEQGMDAQAQAEAPEQEAAADASVRAEAPTQEAAAEASVQAEAPEQEAAADASVKAEAPTQEAAAEASVQLQAGGMWNAQAGNMPNGQPQAGGMWNAQAGNMANGQPQAGGMWNAQAGNMPNGQPQAGGMWNAQAGNMANGQPQAGGMWNAQAGNMPNGQPQAGGMWNAQAGSVPYAQTVKPPKKPFVMPAAVNIIFAILAVAAAAFFVCVLVLGKPKEQKSELAVSTMAVPAEQQAVEPGEELNVDFSGVAFELEIPETDAYREAQELAEGYIFADSDTRSLTQEDLTAHTDDELWYAYYEILARAGVDLSEIDDDMHEYFQRKSWYEPDILLSDLLYNMSDEQIERFSEMLENGEDPSYDIMLEAGVLNETEANNMKMIEEYVTYGTTSGEGTEDAIEDMLEE